MDYTCYDENGYEIDNLVEHSQVLTEAFINHACNPEHTKLFHLVGKRGWDEIQATETTAYQDAIVKELRAIAWTKIL